MIIIEGPDGTGKTHLVRRLAAKTGLRVFKLKEIPETPFESMEKIERAKSLLNMLCIQDRFAPIAEYIYEGFACGLKQLITDLKVADPILIYCSIQMQKNKHKRLVQHKIGKELRQFSLPDIYGRYARLFKRFDAEGISYLPYNYLCNREQEQWENILNVIEGRKITQDAKTI